MPFDIVNFQCAFRELHKFLYKVWIKSFHVWIIIKSEGELNHVNIFNGTFTLQNIQIYLMVTHAVLMNSAQEWLEKWTQYCVM